MPGQERSGALQGGDCDPPRLGTTWGHICTACRQQSQVHMAAPKTAWQLAHKASNLPLSHGRPDHNCMAWTNTEAEPPQPLGFLNVTYRLQVVSCKIHRLSLQMSNRDFGMLMKEWYNYKATWPACLPCRHHTLLDVLTLKVLSNCMTCEDLL